jgi:hypothetical protein
MSARPERSLVLFVRFVKFVFNSGARLSTVTALSLTSP